MLADVFETLVAVERKWVLAGAGFAPVQSTIVSAVFWDVSRCVQIIPVLVGPCWQESWAGASACSAVDIGTRSSSMVWWMNIDEWSAAWLKLTWCPWFISRVSVWPVGRGPSLSIKKRDIINLQVILKMYLYNKFSGTGGRSVCTNNETA